MEHPGPERRAASIPIGLWCAVVLALASVLLLPNTPPALAVACDADNAADDFNWSDHEWVGWAYPTTCDTDGMYALTVQRINIAIPGDAARSSADGWYGTNTHLDVEDVQSAWGIGSDGLVGPGSWGYYDAYALWNRTESSGIQFWRLWNYNTGADTFKWGNPEGGNQVCVRNVSYYQWKQFTIGWTDYCYL